jgi:mannose-6-phosphate isomerase-like protein (cupin superfamily)
LSEREIVCAELVTAIDDLRRQDFRLDLIYPADKPHTAVLSRDGESVRLTTRPGASLPADALPSFAPEFVVTRTGGSPGEGRAGMLYRDLIPSRLGGRYIASHISIPHGGPSADWVHFHRIALQMLYVRRGWVRVVYEHQGEPFVMHEGDLVLQPPQIRHRVLESSPGFEVIEVGAPALHATFADHELELPNGLDPARAFGAQHFLHHIAADAPWTAFGAAMAQETRMKMASAGLAEVRTVRPGEATRIDFPPHRGELVFGFLLDGSATLHFDGELQLKAADAFVIPPEEPWRLTDLSPDLRLLHICTGRLG